MISAKQSRRLYASAWPELRLAMLLARRKHLPAPFPFNSGDVRYYYLARNAIYALARMWQLHGGEALLPAYCHGVEVEALLHAGVRVRFYPVLEGMKVSEQEIISRVTPHTRAVYVIHYAGFPTSFTALAEFCKRKNLLLIEDCALALFSRAGEQPLGSVGDAAIFCLYKTLPLPNGGAVALNSSIAWTDIPQAPRLRSALVSAASAALHRHRVKTHRLPERLHSAIRWTGRAVMKTQLARVGTNHFEPALATLGMTSVCHRIIAAQDAEEIVRRRRRNYRHMLARLHGVAKIVFPELPEGVCPLFFPLQTPHKAELVERLVASGIEAINFWSQPASGTRTGQFPEVDELRRSVVELPCHQDLTVDTVDWIADQVIRLRPLL